MPGRKYSAANGYRYGFNKQERSIEIDINGNSMSAEFWQYDARLGRRWNVEPEIKKYSGFSSFLAFRDNPLLYSDVNGEDVIILTWVTRKGDPGHTAIAVRDYKEVKQKIKGKWETHIVPSNTYTLYELGPANSLPHSEAAFEESFTANYNPRYGVTYDELFNNKLAGPNGGRVSKYDGFPSDGFIIIPSNYKEDSKIKENLEAKNDAGEQYQTVKNNCTSYCSDVILLPSNSKAKIDAKETFKFGDSKYTMETPIKLYTEIIRVEGNAALIIRAIPDTLIKPIEAAYTTNPKRGDSSKK